VTAAGDSVVGIDAAKRYDVTVVTVGESALTIHPDAEANLLNTSWTLGGDTEEIPYDRISDADYTDGTVHIRRTDGDDRSYPADRRPDELLSAIAGRQSSASG